MRPVKSQYIVYGNHVWKERTQSLVSNLGQVQLELW